MFIMHDFGFIGIRNEDKTVDAVFLENASIGDVFEGMTKCVITKEMAASIIGTGFVYNIPVDDNDGILTNPEKDTTCRIKTFSTTEDYVNSVIINRRKIDTELDIVTIPNIYLFIKNAW